MKNKWVLFLLVGIFAGCSRNAITGKNQISLYPESDIQAMSYDQYDQFLQSNSNKVIAPAVDTDAEMVERVGERLTHAIQDYYSKQGLSRKLQGYRWEFHLVESKEVNAWCLPGGKIIVYTGLLKATKDEASLAIVLGHEITHALARHGNERMSEAGVQQLGGVALSVAVVNQPSTTRSLFLNSYGINSEMGVFLPFTRKQEQEADKLGLRFAALAGYDPREAVPFWEHIKENGDEGHPPAILTTHPVEIKRIEKLKEELPNALNYYHGAPWNAG